MSDNRIQGFIPPSSIPFGDPRRRYVLGAEDIPILQIVHNDGVIGTYAPGGQFAAHVSITLDALRELPIDRPAMIELAAILGTQPTAAFQFDAQEALVAFAAMIIKGWHSPRWYIELYQRLEIDPLGTIERYAGDAHIIAAIGCVLEGVNVDLRNPLSVLGAKDELIRVAAHARGVMQDLIHRGRPDDKPQALFFHHVVMLADRYGSDLRLPARETGKTPLFQFADVMRRRLAAYGMRLADEDRFGRIGRMRRGDLVATLDRARTAYRKEKRAKSTTSFNSPGPR
jgi:hypothetical protein